MQKLEEKIKNMRTKYEFLRACEKVRHTHNNVNKLRLKIIKTCLADMEKVGIPTVQEERDLLIKMLKLYDETIGELSKEPERFRKYVDLKEREREQSG